MDYNDWSPFAEPLDTASFLELVNDELRARSLVFMGTPPKLESARGELLYLDNLARRCSVLKRKKWRAVVGEFLDTVALVASIDDPLAMSREVARESLRLRLAPIGDKLGDRDTDPRTDRHELASLEAKVLRRPAMPGVEWMLYIRIPGGGVSVIDEHLDQWGIDVEEAWSLARDRSPEHSAHRSRRVGDVRILEGPSMFTHTAVLNPRHIMPNAPDGWFVAVPCREQVLVLRASGTERGLRAMVDLVTLTSEQAALSGYPLITSPWYVPPTGIGPFGEDAELVELRFDRCSGVFRGVRFGPLVNDLFGEPVG